MKLSPTCQIPILGHFIERYLSDIPIPNHPKHFVEVGAFDGESFSNTSGLADVGWRGLYIEPHPDYAKRCEERHKLNNVSVANVAVDYLPGTKCLFPGSSLTTMCQETFVAFSKIEWSKDVHFSKSMDVQAVRLDRLLVEYQIPMGFELLVVDVEGYEMNVFRSFQLSDWRPKMIIVELNDFHPSFSIDPYLTGKSAAVRAHILRNNYLQVYADYINSIFVERDALKKSFS